QAIHVLLRRDRGYHCRLVDVRGQRQLHQHAVPARVGVEVRDHREERVLRDLRGEADGLGPDADLGRVARLAPDVRDRRRVVADEHDREPGFDVARAQALDLRPQLVQHLSGDRGPVDDARRQASPPRLPKMEPGPVYRSPPPPIVRGRELRLTATVEFAVGIDIIEIARVRKVLERHPQRFLDRVYTPEEVAFCRGRIAELAARFAAKEAVMKALGTGARGLAWREIEILPNRRGKPLVYLHGLAKKRGET